MTDGSARYQTARSDPAVGANQDDCLLRYKNDAERTEDVSFDVYDATEVGERGG